MKTSYILSVLFLFVTMTATHAAIVVTGTDSFVDVSGQNPISTDRTISDFSVSTGEKLVVTTTMEGAGDISGITFGGTSLHSVYNTSNGVQRITTYYLDVAAATTDDVVVSFTGTCTIGFAAISFSGAATGGPSDFASSATQNSGLFDTENGSLVIGAFTVNTPGTIVPSTPSTEIYYERYIGNGGTSGNSSYYFSTTDGTESYGFTGGSTRPAAGAVVFNVIPEPSSIALLGLAGLSLVLFSRRRR